MVLFFFLNEQIVGAHHSGLQKILLLDEPLGALDAKIRKQMQIELKKIQQEVGITFIYVTHDQEEALSMPCRGHQPWR